MCTVFSVWLNNRFDIGAWVVIVGVMSGVAASGLNMFNFIKTVNKEMGGKADGKEHKD